MDEKIKNIKENVGKQKKISDELKSFYNQLSKAKTTEEKEMINSQIRKLQQVLQKINSENMDKLHSTNVSRPLQNQQITEKTTEENPQKKKKSMKFREKPKDEKILDDTEKASLKRLRKKKEKTVEKKELKSNAYIKLSNKFFSGLSRSLLKKGNFKPVETSIIKSKLKIIPPSYLSIMFFSTIVSVFAAALIFLFFLFFTIKPVFPIIAPTTEDISIRFVQTFWILILVPLVTYMFMYFYPILEEKSAAMKINQELPFATIHMSAISGSMIEPTKIFEILISTKEYPYLEKEFTRLINEVNIYGYDLVTAMKNISLNSPSKKLSELLNGLATTISSGGNLPDFFEKRSESLLFDYKIEREKYTKSSETFMDIYISVVIAAPMILMLLLIMMKISGLGIALSTGTITLMTILGVFIVNIVFLTFLHLKQPAE